MTRDIIVCSLERWDDVWRRNQFLVRELLALHPERRVLFVAPAWDAMHGIVNRRPPPGPALRTVEIGRLWELTPRKWLPRLAGPFADRSLYRQVGTAVQRVGLTRPVLWVNDSVYAGLVDVTGYSTVYDITDDWLLLPFPDREIVRRRAREASLLRQAAEVVVCSENLAASRGRARPVHLIPNAVDADAFRRPAPRPLDLPAGATAVYVGTLHDDRIDVDLVVRLAAAVHRATVVLVGPNCLSRTSQQRLDAMPNVRVLGSRPYATVPAYLQHASVVIVPHRVTPFTASLDPIKAYECEAVGTPTVATPLPGFVPDRGCIRTAAPGAWVEAVRAMIEEPPAAAPTDGLPTWRDRARVFDTVLQAAVRHRPSVGAAEPGP